MSAHIAITPHVFDVLPIIAELSLHNELWNEYTGRLSHPMSPHRDTDDIWLRFAEENLTDKSAKTDGPHRSVWFPASKALSHAKSLALKMFTLMNGTKLGGVLFIRVPPGKSIYPHIDNAWHAKHYSKFAVQISGHANQEFAFEDGSLSALPGESYLLDNSFIHWVTNPTSTDWINMTVCYRSD